MTRNRRGGGNRARLDSITEESGRASMSEDTSETPTLDCVICYNEIDVNDRRGYMLAPCDHIFHRRCLETWMDVKVGGLLSVKHLFLQQLMSSKFISVPAQCSIEFIQMECPICRCNLPAL